MLLDKQNNPTNINERKLFSVSTREGRTRGKRDEVVRAEGYGKAQRR
jgi:hypothetical protein